MPARNLRIMRSAISGLSADPSTVNSANETLPVSSASLWQTWQ